MGDLEHLDEDAGHQIGGLVSVGQQPGEDVMTLLPADCAQDPALGGAKQYPPLCIEPAPRP